MQTKDTEIKRLMAENRRLEKALCQEKQINRALKLKLSHSQAMLETTSTGAFIMTETFVECNFQACRIWKAQKDEIIGKSPADFAPLYQPNGEKSHDMANRKIQSALQGRPQRFFWKDRQTDGTIIDTEVFLKPVTINGIKHVAASIRDITRSKRHEKNSASLIQKMTAILEKRKIAHVPYGSTPSDYQANRRTIERELEMADIEFEKIFETADDGLVLIDNHKHVLKVNPAYSRLAGISRNRVAGQKCYDIFPCTGCEKGVNCKPAQLLLKSDHAEFETRCINDKGQIIPCIVSARLLKDSSEQQIGILQSFKDIGSYKSGIDRVKASEKMHRVILSSISDAVFITNNEGNFFFISPGVKQIFGFSLEEIWWMDNIEKLLGKRFFSIKELDEKQEIRNIELKILDKSDNERCLNITVKRVEIGGGTVLITCHDVTEDKIRSKQLEQAGKMVTLGILVSGMGHEINNPNQYIGLNAPLLARVWKDAAQILEEAYRARGEFRLAGIHYSRIREKIPLLFDGIIQGSQRIKSIVSDLKNYSRQDASGLENVIYINSAVKHSLTLVNNQIKKSTRNFTVSYSKATPQIKGNFQQVEQVIINLVQNACEALTNSEQALHIETGTDPAGFVILRIKDQGEGIKKEHLDHITDPFFTTKRNCGGTGLGLSISQKIIKEHGGHLVFTSTPGRGTIVTAMFPAVGQGLGIYPSIERNPSGQQ